MEAYSGQADVSLFSDFGTGLCYPPSACCVNLRSIQCPLKSFPGQSCPATRPPPPFPSSPRPLSDMQQSLHPGGQGQQAWEQAAFCTLALLCPGTRPQLCPQPGLLCPPPPCPSGAAIDSGLLSCSRCHGLQQGRGQPGGPPPTGRTRALLLGKAWLSWEARPPSPNQRQMGQHTQVPPS